MLGHPVEPGHDRTTRPRRLPTIHRGRAAHQHRSGRPNLGPISPSFLHRFLAPKSHTQPARSARLPPSSLRTPHKHYITHIPRRPRTARLQPCDAPIATVSSAFPTSCSKPSEGPTPTVAPRSGDVVAVSQASIPISSVLGKRPSQLVPFWASALCQGLLHSFPSKDSATPQGAN